MAAGPLYVSLLRASVVDFTRPFMNISTTFLLPANAFMHLPANSIEHLLAEKQLTFGSRRKSHLVRALRTSNDTLSRRVWNRLQSFGDDVMTDSNRQGIERVRRSHGRYAFMLPSDIADVARGTPPCDVRVFGRFLHDRHLAFATPKHSRLLPLLNTHLLELERSGHLQKLYNKWWLERSECAVVSTSYSQMSMTSRTSCESLSLCCTLALAVGLIWQQLAHELT